MEPNHESEHSQRPRAAHSAPRLEPRRVPGGWLEPFEDTDESRAVEDYVRRLKGDQELVQDLQWEGYAGPRWDRFAEVLVAYGYQVLMAWILTGTIFAKCRAQGLRGIGPGPGLRISREDAEELTRASVGFAVTAFRDVLKPRVWTAAGGATLKTFFIGHLLIQFVPMYKTWGARSMAGWLSRSLPTWRCGSLIACWPVTDRRRRGSIEAWTAS